MDQMERLLQHQNSTVAFSKNQGSCMWGWLQSLDRQFHSPKLLQDSNNHGDSSRNVKGLKSYAPLIGSEANLMQINKGNAKKRSGKALIKALLSKKLFRKHYRKQRELLRTVSIHHLECNDYVQDEMTSDSKFPEIDFNSGESDSSPGHEKVPLLSEGEMSEMYKARWKEKESVFSKLGRVMTLQLEDLVSTELLNAQRELLAKTIEDQNIILEARPKEIFTRSGSFPAVVSSGRRNAQRTKLKNRLVPSNSLINQKAKSLKSGMMADSLDSESSDVAKQNSESSALAFTVSNELKHQKDDRTHLDFPSEPTPHSSVDDKNEYRKEHKRILMDSVLHRVPYGQTTSEDLTAMKLFRSTSARTYGDYQNSKISIPSRGYPDPSFQRSRSLTESLGRYSRIIDTISTREPLKLPENLILAQEYKNMQEGTTAATSFGELRFNSAGRDAQNAAFHGSISPKTTFCRSKNEDEMLEIHDNVDTTPVNTLEAIKETIEDLNMADTLAANEEETSNGGLKWSENVSELNREVETTEQITHVQNEFLEISDSSLVATSLIHEKETVDAARPSNEIEPSSPTLDGPKHNDTELEPVVHAEPDYCSSNQPEQMGADILDQSPKSNNLTDADTINVRVDQEDEAGFNYVRNILSKSRFPNLDLLDESPYSPLLHRESAAPSDEVDVDSSDSEGMTPDQQVLLDLINEALLESYQNLFLGSWFSRFDSRLRVSLAANHLIQEVWTKISWKLSSRTKQNYAREDIIAQDLSKDDRWLNLLLDAQNIGMELEGLILDNLLDELLMDF